MMNPFCKDKKIEDTKVVVAMSGGVDSSVVATMLHKRGYQVIGVTLQLYDLGVTLEKKGACCAGKDIYDAKNVADKMGFPHYVLNYESIFKQEVMDDFADSYLRGETPVPCIKCNQSVKFRDLFKVAKDLNADALATGHYVQRKVGANGHAELHKAFDESKDQSYFLFATTQDQLDYIHFPLGGMKKEDTRKLALEYGLEVADKPDSQDICFVPNGSYTKVIERLRPDAWEAGEIVHINGEVLGKHDGIVNYTIGQRKGLGIGWPEPLYVVKVDADSRQVIVGPESSLYSEVFSIRDVNWLDEINTPTQPIEIAIKTRSAQAPVNAIISDFDGKVAKVKLLAPQRAVTPGQACVIYDGTRVLGGGWIERNAA
jgi:tRNA-specific 2-thiouridylase